MIQYYPTKYIFGGVAKNYEENIYQLQFKGI